jgi:hypothetical protein
MHDTGRRGVVKGLQATAGLVALLVVVSETTLSLLLITGIGQPVTGVLGAALVALISLAVILNLVRGRKDLACGCMGPHKQTKISWLGLANNAGLILLCSVSAVRSTGTIAGSLVICAALMLLAAPQIRNRRSALLTA